MTKRLIDRDPITGVECWYEYQPSTDSATISHVQDVSMILDRNKIAANDDDKTKRGFKNDWWKYADIPAGVWLKWKLEKGVDIFNRGHKKELFKLLNDPDYRYLKTTSKHHSV